MVRGFARYLARSTQQTEIPSEDLLRATLPRVAPYLYSTAEIAALMNAARELTPPLRAATFETIIGLLAVSGLRAGEALGLDRADVDLHDGALTFVPANRTSSARSRCTTPRPGAASSTPGCVTDPSRADLTAFFVSPPGTGDQRRVQRDVREADPAGRTGGPWPAGPARPARSQALRGRRGYAPCRAVWAGEGAVGW